MRASKTILISLAVPFVIPTVLYAPSVARAQTTSAKAASREHFNRGVAAFDTKRFGEAAEEFSEAYRSSPAFVVLYNIGQVNVALGRSVEAVDAYDKYLKQGASAVPAERRKAVLAEIETQLGRIGTIAVRTFPEGADVRVDGALVGKTPLHGSVRVTAGRHTVEASLADYAPQVREQDVAGRAEIALELTLKPVVVSPPPAAPPVAQATPAPPPTAEAPRLEPKIRALPAVIPGVEKTPQPSSQAGGRHSSVSGVRVVGYLLLLGGLAGATVGGLQAYSGANQASDARDRLANAATPAAWDMAKPDYDAGKSRSQRGWIIAGISAAALIGGIVLIATAPEGTTVASLGPWMAAEASGLELRGRW